MKIEKFLYKISQDERMKKITYEKCWGYSLILKEGYGVIKKVQRGYYFNNIHCGYGFKTTVETFYQKTTQSRILNWLKEVEKVNLEEIDKLNNEDYLNVIRAKLNQIELDIEIKEAEITKMKDFRKKIKDEVNRIKL